MPTRKQLEDAMINAMQSGDDAAAQLFADEIGRLKTEKIEAPSGFMRGFMDPINAGAQILEKLVPSSVSQSINQFNNWLVDQGIPLERMPEGGFDQWLREDEKKYQQARGDAGVDWGRIGGNILNPVNLLAASRVPQAATLLGKVGTGAAAGGLLGMAQPVTEGDFLEEKAKQAGIGAVTGGLMPMVTSGLSRVIKPQTRPEVQQLLREGVTPTPGQILGGTYKTTEEAMTSLPLVGDAIAAGQNRAIKQFNKAVINRSLTAIGKKLPKDIKPGRDALNYADEVIGDAYDDLLPKLKGRVDAPFKSEIDNVLKMAESMPEDKYNQLQKIVQKEIYDRFTSHGLATGSTLKQIESKLGKDAHGYMKSFDYDQQNLGSALREIQESLRRMINRNNPKYKGQLKTINKAFAHYLRAERAMSSVGAKDDLFTPAQFDTAVKALDSSRRKKLYALGKAFDRDISKAGRDVLTNRVPDSGTPKRLLLNAAALGGGAMANPMSLGLAGAASIPYAPGVQRAMAGLLTQRPEIAAPLSSVVNESYPYLIPGMTSMFNQEQ